MASSSRANIMAWAKKRMVKSDAVEKTDRAIEEPEASQAGGSQERNHQGSGHGESGE